MREFNYIASANISACILSVSKRLRNSRDKQFSSMASGPRVARKRIYLSLRPQLQLLNGNVHCAREENARGSPGVRRYFC